MKSNRSKSFFVSFVSSVVLKTAIGSIKKRPRGYDSIFKNYG